VHYLAFIRDVGCEEERAVETPHTTNAAHATRSAALPSTLTVERGEEMATMTMSGTAAAAGTVSEADVHDILTKICLFLQERRPRIGEFFPDGDELRHQHVTPTRFRHCLSMLGLTAFTESELRTLENAFASVKCPGEVDYPAFVCTLRSMLADGVGVAAVTQRRRGGSTTTSSRGNYRTSTVPLASETNVAFAKATLRQVQRMLRARRTATITAFREYDRSRKGFVTDGQFFACLQALGVSLRPDEASALLQLYGVGGGQVHYLPFAQEVDDAALVSVS
jgi:hypothetical protein